MKRSVAWSASVPPGRLAGVVYCLHGYHNDHRFALDTVHLDAFAAAGQLPLAIAAVDGGADSYWHPRADGSDAQAMLLHEFIPMMESRLRVANRAILGWSMGGYGALLAAEVVPGHFRAVAAASPALWLSADATAPGAFDGAADYASHDVFRNLHTLAGTMVRLDCGNGDPFYPATKRLAAMLPQPHTVRFANDFHNAAFWRSVAPQQLQTIAAALGV
jgi:enterochelin esterase-like enzyme